MRTRTRFASIGVMVAASAAVGIAVAALAAPDETVPPESAPDFIMAEGVDHLPSETAADWITYADHVVVVTAVEEETLPPAPIEIERGEGLLARTVTLRIDQVLWSSESAAQPAPETWVYGAVGSQFTRGDVEDPTPIALAHRPRVEVGHSYVMAMRWEAAQCSEGDATTPAQWRGLGEGSEIPYDDETLGQGESEGVVQTAQQFAVHAAEEGAGLEEQLAGQSADALITALENASPDVSALSEVESLAAEDNCG